MSQFEKIILSRDCDAVLIPQGTLIHLPKDSEVFIVQALGGSYTVHINGNLARIEGQDADALGYEATEKKDTKVSEITGDGSVDEELVWEQLRNCYDPEIPVNIVELGLIYECKITPLETPGNRIDITMTLTAPGCGMGEFLVEDIRNRIACVPNISDVNVELTFDPPWNQSMMSEAAKLQTGMYY